MEEVRIQHPKPQLFSNNKVLVGNWFEEHCNYQKHKFKHITEYKAEYERKPRTTYPPAVLWDARIKAQGNLGNFDMTDSEKNDWTNGDQEIRVTEYEADFLTPEKYSYKFTRWTRPTAVKSKYGKEHRPYPPDHPRFSKFNPITWECKIHFRN